MLYKIIRYFLFLLDAEKSHNIALKALKALERFGLSAWLFRKPVKDPVVVMGLTFDNKVGLAAGLDKNADYIDGLAATGFGFIEVGTVTPKPQPGNEQPRLFRLPEAGAIINRMGFNNLGVDHLMTQVKNSHYKGILGINIGKNFSTPVENAVDDYLICFEKVYTLADYITINISSPNTPGLRTLQHGDALVQLLTALKSKQSELNSQLDRYVPIAVKIAPDLSDEEINELATTFLATKIDAIIATNTTSSRVGVEDLEHGAEAGGLSGEPVFNTSTAVVKAFSEKLNHQIPIIAVGGVSCAYDAVDKIKAGASLVQVYSGFIYHGADLIHDCAEALRETKD